MATGNAEPYGREGLALDEARQRILDAIKARPTRLATVTPELMPLRDALGRVIADAVKAPADVPGFRASIMDGYALGQDCQPNAGDSWTLVGRSAPADPYQQTLHRGEAIRILTGAPLPQGAAWVLPQELVTNQDGTIRLLKDASSNPWIRPADEECSQGSLLLASGDRLGVADIGRASSCGISHVKVQRRPRIGLLVTGDELVPPGEERSNGAIWESNSTLIRGMLERLGYPAVDCRLVADECQLLKQAILDLAASCDVIVSTGGVSAGDSDWIRPLMKDLGQVEFWKLFLKPGRPFAFGWISDAVPFFGLPGNPVAATVTALQLLWPALQILEGQPSPELLPRVHVRLATPYRRKPGRPELARASLDCSPDGQLLARIDGSQASSRIGSLQNADLLVEIPSDSGPLDIGQHVWAQLLRRRIL